MIISSTLLKNSVETYNRNKRLRENYDLAEGIANTFSVFVDTIILIFAILFFIMELLVMVYAIIVALSCTSPGPERITHLVLAITFTIPYMLFNVMFNTCAIKVLKSSKGLLPFQSVQTASFEPKQPQPQPQPHLVNYKSSDVINLCY
jgi:hypothetical protein